MNYLDTPLISIDPNKCKRDGLCARVCPVLVYNIARGEVPSVSNPDECCLCGQCVAICPSGALQHSGFAPADIHMLECNNPLTPEAAHAFLAQRRSVRNYKNEIPPRELLEKVLEVAAYAPGSPHHRIGWERDFIVVSGEEGMQTVLQITADYLQKTYDLISSFVVRAAAHFDDSARAAMAVKPDLAMRLREYREGRDMITYHAPAAIFAIAPAKSDFPQTDCSTALYAALLMAPQYGLGSCWNGLLQSAACGDHLTGFTRLSDFLKIPPGYKCYAAATIGYPAIKIEKVPQRKVGISFI